MEYIWLFNRKKEEKRKERDFRIWIHQEETIVTLDLLSSDVLIKPFQADGRQAEFMLLYKLLRYKKFSVTREWFKKFVKNIKRANLAISPLDCIEVTNDNGFSLIALKEKKRNQVADIMTEIFFSKEFQEQVKKCSNEVLASNLQQMYIDKTIRDMDMYLLLN